MSFEQSNKEGGGSDTKATFQPSLTINITNCSNHVRKVGGHYAQQSFDQKISSVVHSVYIPCELWDCGSVDVLSTMY